MMDGDGGLWSFSLESRRLPTGTGTNQPSLLFQKREGRMTEHKAKSDP
jgi:hypothetical protein